MTKRKPHPLNKGGRPPVPIEQRKHWTLLEIRGHCRITVTDCWEWKFNRSVSEYQQRNKQLGHAGRQLSARQVAFLLVTGGLPADGRQLVPVKCRNPRCINPMHCRPATVKEKVSIAVQRGTFVTPERTRRMVAAKQALCGKIDMDQAREIRATEGPAREHAPKYGISTSLFNRIRRGAAWKEQ